MANVAKKSILPDDKFNYGLFKADICDFCKEKDITLRKFSTDYLLHSESFLSHIIVERRLTIQIATAVCKIIDKPMKRYEIEKPKPVPVVPAPVVQTPATTASTDWECKMMVSEEFGIVSVAIFHNGKEICKGHAQIKGDSDTAIAKSISYAAHICYKNLEQKDFVNRIAADDVDAEYDHYAFGVSVPFKEYIRQYTAEKTPRGELARYVSQNYAKFPSWGEKKIRGYLVVNKASKQVTDAFDSCWLQYRNWTSGK